MAALKASNLILMNNSSISSLPKQRRSIIMASITTSKPIADINITNPLSRHQTTGFMQKELCPINHGGNEIFTQKELCTVDNGGNELINQPDPLTITKLYTIMEAVADRIEMHRNIGDQRADWNRLLLTSINAATLSAATMAGIASFSGGGGGAAALKLSSTVLYMAATGMLVIMNKIQPSQLAEEQRNAVRLFEQIQNQIRTLVAVGNPTANDVAELMDKVLALDRAYPLPLLGAMLEKFPAEVQPAVWWPERRRKPAGNGLGFNGWNRELEEELWEMSNVIRTKDKEDYLRLGGRALGLNKVLAIAGPALTGLAAVGSAFAGSPWGVTLGVAGGALASVVNALEHGGQVGMVFEMYRSNAGFFKMVEDSIVANLREEDPARRENGEVFETKVGLQLGRSLSEMKSLAAEGREAEEFASKLF